MAKPTTTTESGPGLIQRIQGFFEDIINELKKVTWPTRDDLMASTKVTLYMLLIMGVITFVFDRVFAFIIMNVLHFVSLEILCVGKRLHRK